MVLFISRRAAGTTRSEATPGDARPSHRRPPSRREPDPRLRPRIRCMPQIRGCARTRVNERRVEGPRDSRALISRFCPPSCLAPVSRRSLLSRAATTRRFAVRASASRNSEFRSGEMRSLARSRSRARGPGTGVIEFLLTLRVCGFVQLYAWSVKGAGTGLETLAETRRWRS